MVDRAETLRQKARESFEQFLQDFVEARLQVFLIDATIPQPEVVSRIKQSLDLLSQLDQAAEEANAFADFSFLAEQTIILDKLVDLKSQGILDDETVNYFREYSSFSYINNKKRYSGVNAELLDDTMQKLEANAAAGTTELQNDLTTLQPAIDTARQQIVETTVFTQFYDPKISLEQFLNRAPVDSGWELLSIVDVTKGTPIHAIPDFPRFDRDVKYAVLSIDGGAAITTNEVTYLSGILDNLDRDAVVFRAHPDVIKAIHDLQGFLREVLFRNSQVTVLTEVKKDAFLKDLLQPALDFTYSEVRIALAEILDDATAKDIEKANQIGRKLAAAQDPTKAVGNEERTFLSDLHQKLEKRIEGLEREYLTELIATGKASDPDLWESASRAVAEARKYLDWTETLLAESGAIQAGPGERHTAPELEDAQEVWENFFLSIARGPTGLEQMEKWGGTIMKSFYPSAEPTESHKNKLETRRFSGWKDALSTVAQELKTDPDAYHPMEFLRDKLDKVRLVTDAMITFSQSRALTSDWHSDEMLIKLKKESQALHGFKPETVDFFTEPGERHHPEAELITGVVDEMKLMLITPGSPYFRKNWQEDDSSRDALKAEMRVWVRDLKTPAELNDNEVSDIVDIAYTIAAFCGLRFDTFSESMIWGDSPVGAIAERRNYPSDLCPPIGYLYAAYESPKFLPELEIVYPPDDLIELWEARFVTPYINSPDQKTREGAEDIQRRIASIKLSIAGTKLALGHFAPLRTEADENDPNDIPFGYRIDRYSDGMIKWQYPSMYRYMFEPESRVIRKKYGYTFEQWVDGLIAFKSIRKKAHADLDIHGKKPDEAIEFLMGNLNELIGQISGLKANELLDWNYIVALYVMFIDRMFRAFAHVDAPAGVVDAKRRQLYDRIIQVFGTEPWQVNAAKRALTMLSKHMPTVPANMANNKLTTAGKINMDRTIYYPSHGHAHGHVHHPPSPWPSELPFGEVISRLIREDSEKGNMRRQTIVHMPFPDNLHATEWALFKAAYPGFEGTVKPYGQSTDDQQKTAKEVSKK